MGIGRVAAGASLWLLLTRIVGGDSGSCDTSALLDLRWVSDANKEFRNPGSNFSCTADRASRVETVASSTLGV